jgi:hypothetical protein
LTRNRAHWSECAHHESPLRNDFQTKVTTATIKLLVLFENVDLTAENEMTPYSESVHA